MLTFSSYVYFSRKEDKNKLIFKNIEFYLIIRFTCGHILHWYFLPDVPPFDPKLLLILLAFIGCGTTNKDDGVLPCP